MKYDRANLITGFVIVIVLSSSAAACFWAQNASEDEFSVTGTVTGLSSYNQPKLDIKSEEILDRGIGLG